MCTGAGKASGGSVPERNKFADGGAMGARAPTKTVSTPSGNKTVTVAKKAPVTQFSKKTTSTPAPSTKTTSTPAPSRPDSGGSNASTTSSSDKKAADKAAADKAAADKAAADKAAADKAAADKAAADKAAADKKAAQDKAANDALAKKAADKAAADKAAAAKAAAEKAAAEKAAAEKAAAEKAAADKKAAEAKAAADKKAAQDKAATDALAARSAAAEKAKQEAALKAKADIEAKAAADAKVAADAKAKKDASAMALLQRGNITSGTKITQEMLDLGYRGKLGRNLSAKDAAEVNNLVKATGVKFLPQPATPPMITAPADSAFKTGPTASAPAPALTQTVSTPAGAKTTTTGTQVDVGQTITKEMKDLGASGAIGSPLSSIDASKVNSVINSTGVSYTPGNVGLSSIQAGDTITDYMKQLGATGPVGTALSATDSLRLNQVIKDSGTNTIVTKETPAGPQSVDRMNAGMGIIVPPKETSPITADEIQKGIASPMGGTVAGTVMKPASPTGETQINFYPSALQGPTASTISSEDFKKMYPDAPDLGPTSKGPGTVSPGSMPAATTAPATGIASVAATGGPGTFPPATNTSGIASPSLTGSTSASVGPGTVSPGQLPAATKPAAVTPTPDQLRRARNYKGGITKLLADEANAKVAAEAKAAADAKAAAEAKAKKDALALKLLQSGNIASGTKVTQEMLDLGYRGKLGRSMSRSDAEEVNKLIKATGVTYTPPPKATTGTTVATGGPGTFPPAGMPPASTTGGSTTGGGISTIGTTGGGITTGTGGPGTFPPSGLGGTTGGGISTIGTTGGGITTGTGGPGTFPPSGLGGTTGSTTGGGTTGSTTGGGTTGGGTTGGGTTGGGTTGGGTTGGGTTGGGTTGGGTTGGGTTGGGGTTNTGSGPTACPAGYKLVTDAKGVRTCVPVPTDSTTTGIASVRPVVAPYHKSTSVASLAGYTPFVPGR